MRVPLKLSAIEQEHLQEVYNAAGVARDELPYTEAFNHLCEEFQGRAFKNADREQVFGAVLKYVRSSSISAGDAIEMKLDEEQLKQLKSLIPRHARGGKILPYSDEFQAVQKEFAKLSGTELTDQEFWQAMLRSQGAKRRPSKRAKVAVAADADEEDGE